MIRKTTLKAAVPYLFFATLLATPAAAAAEQPLAPTSLTVSETADACEVVIPAGSSYRLERSAAPGFSISVEGAVAPSIGPEVHGRCLDPLSVAPLPSGMRLDLRVPLEGLRSLEQANGRLRVLYEPRQASEGDDWQAAYRIGVDDKLAVEILKPVHPPASDVVVDKDGNITVAWVGTVKIASLTPVQAAGRLKELLDKDTLVNPEVSVTVKEYASQFVFVGGQVRSPGKKPLRGGTTLKEVLAEAGGFSEQAGDEVVVTREASQGFKAEKVSVSLKDIERDRADLSLRPGDTITVLEKPSFFVLGDVDRNGRYPYEEGVTLLQAISIAGGLREWANQKDVRLLRMANGQIEKQTYDLRDIQKGKMPDVPLKPGDTIFVPRRLL